MEPIAKTKTSTGTPVCAIYSQPYKIARRHLIEGQAMLYGHPDIPFLHTDTKANGLFRAPARMSLTKLPLSRKTIPF